MVFENDMKHICFSFSNQLYSCLRNKPLTGLEESSSGMGSLCIHPRQTSAIAKINCLFTGDGQCLFWNITLNCWLLQLKILVSFPNFALNVFSSWNLAQMFNKIFFLWLKWFNLTNIYWIAEGYTALNLFFFFLFGGNVERNQKTWTLLLGTHFAELSWN